MRRIEASLLGRLGGMRRIEASLIWEVGRHEAHRGLLFSLGGEA